MIISFSSFLAAFSAGNVMVLFLAILMRSKAPLSRFGLNVLLLFSVFIGIRLLLPLEFFYTITFPSKVALPFLFTWLFERPFSLPVGISVYLYQILLTVWISGALYFLIRVFRRHRKFKRLLRCLPTLNSAQVTAILKGIQKERNDDRYIRIVQTPHIATPALTGFVHPVILLPALTFEAEELHYILTHEMDHFYRHDLLWKLCFEILSAVYWWNPLMWILKKELSALIELKADDTVIDDLNAEKRLAYLECLTRIHRNQVQHFQNSSLILTFSNVSPNSLLYRASYIVSNKKQRHSGRIVIICSIILLLSTLFVFESFSKDPEIERTTISSFPDNSYFIKIDDHLYQFYMDERYSGYVTNPYSEEFINFPIYTDESEVPK